MTILFPDLGMQSIGIKFRDKLITNIVENYKYEYITSSHQREKGDNPTMLKIEKMNVKMSLNKSNIHTLILNWQNFPSFLSFNLIIIKHYM